MARDKFSGSIVALITPFRDDAIDEPALKRLVEWHIENGTHGIVAVGTTGESPTLSYEEHMHVITVVVDTVARRIPVMAGTGSNSTSETLMLTRHAQQVGADAALVVTPYYNKPSQSGLREHFRTVHDETDIDLFIYNIPGRSVVDMSVETMAELAQLARIAGVKDATADLARPVRTARTAGSDFRQFSGDDATQLPFLVQGGIGCISVAANVAPRLSAELHEAWQNGDLATAIEINQRLMPLYDGMTIEPNPGPAKCGVELLGLCDGGLRLPMQRASDATREHLRRVIAELG